jgi:ATP/maltotriose-dependent transcriptional regulator MalT
MARPQADGTRRRSLDPGSSAAELPPLAEAKLAAPRLRTDTVPRPRILAALDAGDEAALTLVAAPPGYGKTTAVRAWCASRDAAVAWVTLDAGDNDPARLWTYVATAVDRVRDGLGRRALKRLRIAGGPIESPIDELMNGMAVFGAELVIVLDDVQAVTDTECLASIDSALERLPPTVRVIVISRTDPALALASLRARGALAELRADELAFTTAEARELLVERRRVDLGPGDVETLVRRTEGWPAALLLASIWLRRVDDPHRAVREFGGGHRFVADYLSQVALATLGEDVRSFLLGASVLGRFTAELCDAVLERSDSASLLAELERSNLFVIRLEHGGWLRVHALLAEFARFQLTALDPDAAPAIHRRATAWLRARRLPVEAVEHAVAAGDHEVVAQILLEHHLSLINSGAARTLLRWANTLPDEQLVACPDVAVGAATAALLVGRQTVARRRLLQLVDRAGAERPGRLSPYAEAVAGMVRASAIDGHIDDAVAAGRRAVDVAQAGEDVVLVAALAGYARALYLAGRLDEAWAAALRAVEHPDAERRAPGHAHARSTLALVAADRGRLESARTHAEKAKSIVGGIGSGRSWLGANASVALGVVLTGEGGHAEAERELASAERFLRDEVATVQHAWLLVLLAGVRCRRGRLDEAEATLRRAREAMSELAASGRVASLAEEVDRDIARATTRAGGGAVLEPPSEAEIAVLRMLASELSARQIAAELYLSANTVRSHTRALYRKLGVSSRADAVARAGALGFRDHARSPG